MGRGDIMKHQKWVQDHVHTKYIVKSLMKSNRKAYKPVWILRNGIECKIIWKKKWWVI